MDNAVGLQAIPSRKSCGLIVALAMVALSGCWSPGRAADAPVPLPDNAEEVEYNGPDGRLEFTSASSVKAVADFYRARMKELGWQSHSSVINNANMVVLEFAKGGKAVSFTIMQMGPKVNVSADGSGLIDAAAASDKPAAAEAAELEAEESGGLPVPKRHSMTVGTKTPFRRGVEASVPVDLASVLAFYRRELGKLNWKEEAKGTSVSADSAVVVFTTPEGAAVLKLARKDGETSVNLTVKDPAAATKAGVLPKPGQAKVLFGNMLTSEAVIVIDKRTVKVGAGVGVKSPDGPTLDLPPGKYTYTVKGGDRGELEIGADETWGVVIGPGGALALQAY
jgi:hypothetical protein